MEKNMAAEWIIQVNLARSMQSFHSLLKSPPSYGNTYLVNRISIFPPSSMCILAKNSRMQLHFYSNKTSNSHFYAWDYLDYSKQAACAFSTRKYCSCFIKVVIDRLYNIKTQIHLNDIILPTYCQVLFNAFKLIHSHSL